MAFGGAVVNNFIQQNEAGTARGNNILEITGVTLGVVAGAYNIANADSGRLTTDSTPPANEDAISPLFGPGMGNWLQEDVDAVTALVYNAVVAANVRVGLVAKNLTTGNLEVDIHSVEAGNPVGVTIRLIYEPPAFR